MDDADCHLARRALPLLETEVLRTFVTIAESGSFTRAAQQLFRTPSALSMQIKRMEEMLGQALFIREARHVSLTGEGELLLGYARQLLKINAEAVGRFRAPALEGRVRFGATDDVVERVLSSVLAHFSRTFPAVEMDVSVATSATLLPRFDAGELDLVLITRGRLDLNGRGEIVHSEPLVWAGRDGGVAGQRSPLPLALAQPGCPWRAMALDALDRTGWRYRIVYSCDHCAGQRAAMLADLAVAPFPESLVRPPLKRLDDAGLPELGAYQLVLMKRPNGGAMEDALAAQVMAAFRGR
ncbi:LysR family transcriptional regulator [Corticibacter populi]|uniref:LysR family transcriptional regulator n=1 Tax=Corticibacter populi TaxID=1550736 RepID=A0A3M6QVK8_9BURK|nr:LysR family transcriptional regulator [Corticibacter populi]RMX06532.1 LysR family transcriptional regulator [Corticibacter populi]RZS31904.1 DNA-binding transcriptional LysR family regulator [Corticibacter populi]